MSAVRLVTQLNLVGIFCYAMASKLEFAIRQARIIRKNLLRTGQFPDDLNSACGLASVMLAYKLNDVNTLRMRDNVHWQHVYNVVDRTVVDITATQFWGNSNPIGMTYPSGAPRHGVYISKKYLDFHNPISGRGMSVYRFIAQDWEYKHQSFRRIIDNWIKL
jgi:hypothetical protein